MRSLCDYKHHLPPTYSTHYARQALAATCTENGEEEEVEPPTHLSLSSGNQRGEAERALGEYYAYAFDIFEGFRIVVVIPLLRSAGSRSVIGFGRMIFPFRDLK